MDKETLALLKLFYKDRTKHGADSRYEYDSEGNMIEMDKSKTSTIRTLLTLNEYRSPTLDEIHEMEEKRKEAMAIAVKEYDDAVIRLNEEASSLTRSDKEYMKLNREVAIADERLQQIRYPTRYISSESGVKVEQLRFNQEKRVFPYDIHVLQSRPFSLQEMYVRVGKEAEKPLLTLKEIKKAQKMQNMADRPVILFGGANDENYGFLSLEWPVALTMNGTTYHSAKQAIAVEMAKRLKDQAHVDEFMAIDQPEQIRYSMKDVLGEHPDLITEWARNIIQVLYDVITLKFTQYPALSLRLLETQDAILGAVIENDPSLGIGMSIDDPNAKNSLNWKGQNLVGKALMDIRGIIKQKREETVAMENESKEPLSNSSASTAAVTTRAAITTPAVTTSSTTSMPRKGVRAIRRPNPNPNPTTVETSGLSVPSSAIASTASTASTSTLPA
jgi:ribA/ribD-fused uncharacterized protein